MEVVRLKDITEKITKGTTPSNIGDDFTEHGIMYFRSELIGRTKYVDKTKGLLYITPETHKKLKRSQICENDLLFSMAGIYLGKISIAGKNDVPSNTNQAVALIRLKKRVCNIEYVYYYMKQNWFNEIVCSYSAQAAQPNINLEQIGKLKIQLPNRSLQDKLVRILSAYDNLIENNNKRIRLLEQMAENLYKEWFVRFRFPGHEKVEMENGLPKGWKKGKLRDLAIEVDKPEKADNRNMYNHYLPIDKLPMKSMVLQEEDSVENAESSLIAFKRGDILFGAMRPYFHKVLLAPFGGLTRTTCFVVNAREPNFRLFLYMLMFQKSTIDYASTVAVGSTMPYDRWKDLSRMNIAIPDLATIEKFNNIIYPIVNRISENYQLNKNLSRQRDLLLPRLMSGKLEVKE